MNPCKAKFPVSLRLKQRTFYHPSPTPSAKFTRATEDNAVSADNVNRSTQKLSLLHREGLILTLPFPTLSGGPKFNKKSTHHYSVPILNSSCTQQPLFFSTEVSAVFEVRQDMAVVTQDYHPNAIRARD